MEGIFSDFLKGARFGVEINRLFHGPKEGGWSRLFEKKSIGMG